MKTSIILIAIFSFQVGILYAGNDVTLKESSTNLSSSMFKSLAPTTPSEADFSEEFVENIPVLSSLVPTTPSIAEFDESEFFSTTNLVPTTPASADFDDASMAERVSIDLSPNTPSEADFE